MEFHSKLKCGKNGIKCYDFPEYLIYALDMRPTGFPYRRYGTEKHACDSSDTVQKQHSPTTRSSLIGPTVLAFSFVNIHSHACTCMHFGAFAFSCICMHALQWFPSIPPFPGDTVHFWSVSPPPHACFSVPYR